MPPPLPQTGKAGALVEAVRLLVTLATTAVGFQVGRSWNSWFRTMESEFAVITGALVGAGVGYVLGGVIGRVIRATLDDSPGMLAKLSGPQLLSGTVGLVCGVIVGAAASAPFVALLPGVVGWPAAALVVLILASFGARVFGQRGASLWSPEPTSVRVSAGSSHLIDSSAAIDGRILHLARAGLVRSDVWVPAFVVDELQGIADAHDRSRRRRGRRGLDVLDGLREVEGIEFRVLEETVPEAVDVDAKLLALASRYEAVLVTTDHNLARAAGLRGIDVINPHELGEALRPGLAAGDEVEVAIEKLGSEPGQGVGFLDDGTMVVVADGAGQVGSTVLVEVSNVLRTSVGRMVFARLDA